MSKTRDYKVKASGRIAGTWRAEGEIVSLTPAQAKYEHVEPIAIGIDTARKEDEQTEKAPDLADKAEAEETKRSRARK